MSDERRAVGVADRAARECRERLQYVASVYPSGHRGREALGAALTDLGHIVRLLATLMHSTDRARQGQEVLGRTPTELLGRGGTE